jgi:hypothetical protein
MFSHTLTPFLSDLLAAKKQTHKQARAYGGRNFINVLHEHVRNHEKVLTSRVNSKDDIYDSIKTFFGKGH